MFYPRDYRVWRVGEADGAETVRSATAFDAIASFTGLDHDAIVHASGDPTFSPPARYVAGDGEVHVTLAE